MIMIPIFILIDSFLVDLRYFFIKSSLMLLLPNYLQLGRPNLKKIFTKLSPPISPYSHARTHIHSHTHTDINTFTLSETHTEQEQQTNKHKLIGWKYFSNLLTEERINWLVWRVAIIIEITQFDSFEDVPR